MLGAEVVMVLAISRLARFLLLAGMLIFLLVLVMGSTGAQGPDMRIPVLNDWSHRHVVYSQPTSLTQAAMSPADFVQAVRTVS